MKPVDRRVAPGRFSALAQVYPCCSRLMQWARIDDPVDAVAVHAGHYPRLRRGLSKHLEPQDLEVLSV